jgi:hypothetical protein
MAHDLSVELIAQSDPVLESARKSRLLMAVTRVPDPSLAHEVESALLKDGRAVALCICAEEDGGAEYPFERREKAAILRSTLGQTEGLQHLGRTSESNRLGLLLDGERRKEDRNQSVLSPSQSTCAVLSPVSFTMYCRISPRTAFGCVP